MAALTSRLGRVTPQARVSGALRIICALSVLRDLGASRVSDGIGTSLHVLQNVGAGRRPAGDLSGLVSREAFVEGHADADRSGGGEHLLQAEAFGAAASPDQAADGKG